MKFCYKDYQKLLNQFCSIFDLTSWDWFRNWCSQENKMTDHIISIGVMILISIPSFVATVLYNICLCISGNYYLPFMSCQKTGCPDPMKDSYQESYQL